MDERAVGVLQLEVVLQSWVAWVAWHRLQEIDRGEWRVDIEHETSDERTREATEKLARQAMIWECVRSILTAAAAVSRIKQRLEMKGERMTRGNLAPQVSEFDNRFVRNAFEHVERALPQWLDETGDPDPEGKVALLGWGKYEPAGAKCFRFLNTSSWELRVGQQRTNLKRMVESLRLATLGGQVKLEWD